jgi:uncharacterized protein YjiS (DUF1127 family)
MTIFPPDLSRFLNFIKVCFTRRSRRLARTTVEGLSDRGLQDIGLEPYQHDFDTVKPFWMP